MKSLRIALVLGAVALSQIMCHQSILVAPPGSDMDLIANPPFIAAHGEISVITVVLYDPTGNPVADGTVVQFFTDLGKIPEQAKTNDGVARVNFTSDSRSGTAHITAISGGGSAPTATPTSQPAGDVGASSLSASSAVAGVLNRDTVDVVIGTATPRFVIVTADPVRISDGRTSQITANVFDEEGNPVANVPVVFDVMALSGGAPPSTESMESGSRPLFTDVNGRVTDVLRTRYPRDAAPKSVGVRARTPVAEVEDVVEVFIN